MSAGLFERLLHVVLDGVPARAESFSEINYLSC